MLSMDEFSDEKLIELFVSFEQMRYFDELVKRHIGKIRAMIYPMVLNDADADELTQEVFLKVVKNISKFKGKSKFSTWLYRITVNTVNSFFNKSNKRQVDNWSEPPEISDSKLKPDAFLIESEMNENVTKALAKLSPKLRSAIVMTCINGLSVREAAKVTGCVTATMYWRVHEARRILKVELLIKA